MTRSPYIKSLMDMLLCPPSDPTELERLHLQVRAALTVLTDDRSLATVNLGSLLEARNRLIALSNKLNAMPPSSPHLYHDFQTSPQGQANLIDTLIWCLDRLLEPDISAVVLTTTTDLGTS